jgi:hypothetical protein
VRIGLIFFNVDTLAQCKNLTNFFDGETKLFVNYFVKTEPSGYHKIVIPTQHWFADACSA